MTVAGTYQFRVRAIPKDTEETAYITSSDWVYSDELDIDADEVCTLSGGAVGGPDKADALTPSQLGWIKDDEGWWYRNTDGTYPIGTWKNIDGRWYLFDFSGYMLTGWQQKDGNYYFLDMNGIMQTGWLQDSRKWYYLGMMESCIRDGLQPETACTSLTRTEACIRAGCWTAAIGII